MRLVTFLLFVLFSPAMLATSDPLRNSRQCLVVVARDWNAKSGELHAFERKTSGDNWRARGAAFPVVLGKKGMALGRGLVRMSGAPAKIEGDNKAPAGFFRLSSAFGYAPARNARWVKLRYMQLTKTVEGVDDPRSHFYNKLVDRSKVSRVDWASSEQMLRPDPLYKWGVVVAHNPTAIPAAGSCIFLHIWKDSRTATAGCTAMPEQELVNLLRWLDPAAKPVLIQMPRSEFDGLRSRYRLPQTR